MYNTTYVNNSCNKTINSSTKFSNSIVLEEKDFLHVQFRAKLKFDRYEKLLIMLNLFIKIFQRHSIINVLTFLAKHTFTRNI